MAEKEQKREGFVCECGKFHAFGVYVMAHWNDCLTHTCDECGNQHTVCRGRVYLSRRGKKDKTNG